MVLCTVTGNACLDMQLQHPIQPHLVGCGRWRHPHVGLHHYRCAGGADDGDPVVLESRDRALAALCVCMRNGPGICSADLDTRMHGMNGWEPEKIKFQETARVGLLSSAHPTSSHFSQFNIASFHLKGGQSARWLQDLQGLSQAAQQVLHVPEACVFFATTTVGTYEKTWTAEYMQPNADWRGQLYGHVAKWLAGEGMKGNGSCQGIVSPYILEWIYTVYSEVFTIFQRRFGKEKKACHDHEKPCFVAGGPWLWKHHVDQPLCIYGTSSWYVKV